MQKANGHEKPEIPEFVHQLSGARARLSAASKLSLTADPRLGKSEHTHFAVSHMEACLDALVSLLIGKGVISQEEFNGAVIPALQHHATTMMAIAQHGDKELVLPPGH